MAASVESRRYRPGEVVLVEDGPPATHLYVVRSGSMELVHQGEVIDVVEPGECFGHPSLLSGMAPAFTVRAHEDSVCYLVPPEQALHVLGRPEGATFLASSLRERLVRTGHTVHALPELGTVRVGDLVPGPAPTCDPNTSIGRAARIMSEHDASAVLVPDGQRLTIVTDADLREKVIARELSPDNAVSRVAQDAVVVRAEQVAVDAIVDMLAAGADHLVVVDGRRNVLGIVSAADLTGLESRSPFALRHAILRARDEDELTSAAGRLPGLLVSLLAVGLSPPDVGRVLSLQVDAMTTRLIDFALERYGPAPVPWAWLAVGSVARREVTLASDQENALAYADDAGADAYFERLASDVCDGLVRCGLARDPNDVLASNALWRMTESAWLETVRACFETPDRSHLIRATVAFDFRHVAGGLDIAPELVAILRETPRHPDFVRVLARTATDYRPRSAFAAPSRRGRARPPRARSTSSAAPCSPS